MDRFRPFSTEHLLILVVGFSGIAAFLLLGRRGGKTGRASTVLLAWLNLLANPFSSLAGYLQLGEMNLAHHLPLHLCDLAALAAGIALLTRHRLLSSLTYFWGLAGTIQGILTPAITERGPVCATFFFQHFVIVAAALHLPLVEGWRPRRPLWKAVAEVFGCSVAYLCLAIAMNALTGANYAYASHPPENPSLLDHLGPWPWYLLSIQAIAIVFFSLLCLPFKGPGKPSTKS
jgi:hypothetical integral membrane protein (TIGR02206 family)